MATILQFLFYIFFGVVMVGEYIFNFLQRPVPDFVKSLNESKFMYGIGGFFIYIQLVTGLLTTGAFEVSIDDKLVFSKL